MIEKSVIDPREGLNDDVFYFIGRHTPFINVDALVQLSTSEIVFTWRDDVYTGQGWHIPGGIIRFKEKMPRLCHSSSQATRLLIEPLYYMLRN